MLNGLKQAKALRQQGGGDRESQVQVQQSQVRFLGSWDVRLTFYFRNQITITEERAGKGRLQFVRQSSWVGEDGLCRVPVVRVWRSRWRVNGERL